MGAVVQDLLVSKDPFASAVIFLSVKMKGFSVSEPPVKHTWMDVLQIVRSHFCQRKLILVSGAKTRACFEGWL